MSAILFSELPPVSRVLSAELPIETDRRADYGTCSRQLLRKLERPLGKVASMLFDLFSHLHIDILVVSLMTMLVAQNTQSQIMRY
jgi:hypothetical protein